jgi:peptidoglycan hydrolase-like protein with peptidoglycan-binding domain
MNKLCILLVAFAAVGGDAMADEQIRRIQEELRKRNLYFGEIDGQRTEEIARALQHFQRRKGFKPTGEPDGDTLAALNLTDAPADGFAWPEMAVLKSDVARQLKEEDRKRLESLVPIAEGPSIDEITLAEVGVRKGAPARAEPPVPAVARDAAIPAAQAEEFVRKYLDACETNDLAAETAFYGDRVQYFDHGVVDLAFIEQDVAAFYKRWPTRSYHMFEFKVLEANGDKAVVKFRISFQYRNPTHRVAGKTDNVFTIQRVGDLMKFTSLREQRLRE